MPVRSLSSPVIVWPKRKQVEEALLSWTEREKARRPSLMAVGFFGSYARGDWGVGSDLDLLVIVRQASDPPERRALNWDTTALPVPTDLFVYTVDEWRDLMRRAGRFARTIRSEAKWVYRKEGFEVFAGLDRGEADGKET